MPAVRAAALALGMALVASVLACAALPAAPPVLRVGTSGDYAPFSHAAPGGLAGFDVELARAFAADNGMALQWVKFRWPELVPDLEAGRFDVAMSGVTVRPERSVAGRFCVPGVEGGAVVLRDDARRFATLESLDTPSARIAVNAGGHLERVTRARFPRARILTLPNAEVPDALAAGRADAVVTDVFEAPHWRRRLPAATPLGPFTRDRKAWLVAAGRPDLARRLDAWLLAREADGSLAELRARHLGLERSAAVAQPFAALVAAVDERLALMPAVAEAKRRAGLPVHAPEREARVLDAAVAAVSEAAREAGTRAPPEAAVRAFFAAQIAAAREIQLAVLAGPPGSGEPADLEGELRPALIRIGDRIGWLIARLPAGLDPERARRGALEGLSGSGAGRLSPETRKALAEAVAVLVSAR